MHSKHVYRFLIAGLLLLPASLFSQETTKILLEHADSLVHSSKIRPEFQRLQGNVRLSHDSTMLMCDSAFLNDEKNFVLAYGNVDIRVSDTLNLYGDSLNYDGNTKIAKIWGNVKLIDNETTLTTDTLSFDRTTEIASYLYWGKIVNSDNSLVSKHGYYHTRTKEFYFQKKVILINPDYIMHSDTLMYNTISKVTYFYGPSTIKGTEDSIYCENGWYNTNTDVARFRKNSWIYHQSQVLTGDSIYYEKRSGFGQVFRHAKLIDTVQKTTLMGNYGELHRVKGYAYMVDSAVVQMVDKKDTLFMHSDTVYATFDTGQNIKHILCYYKVKFFRRDLQGMSDSMAYHGRDSTLSLYHNPVLWSEQNQLFSDSIKLTLLNSQIDSMILYNNAFIISKDDTNKFNQVKGRNMVGFFKDNELYKIKVVGNSETVYFAREEDHSLIGITRVYSSDMLIFIGKNQIKSITYINQPKAVTSPEKDVSPYDLKLKGFKWIEEKRPLTKKDIFKW
ncbi:MAG: organic solvent tolerance protein OstA [Bacteroidetes bacterium]|nr:organic solvent tolerance protein OstA [Bacteroidota bacterium]